VRLGHRGVRTEAWTARSHGLTVRVIQGDTASPSGSPPPRVASSTSPTARWATRSASAAASTARRPSPAFAPAPGWRTGASPAVPMYSRWRFMTRWPEAGSHPAHVPHTGEDPPMQSRPYPLAQSAPPRRARSA
jgi:hypothetical protein